MQSVVHYYTGFKISVGGFISSNFGIGRKILRKLHDPNYDWRMRMYTIVRGRQRHDGILYHVHLSNWKRYLPHGWGHLRFYIPLHVASYVRHSHASFIERWIEDYGIIWMGWSMHRHRLGRFLGHCSFVLSSNYVSTSLWKIVISILHLDACFIGSFVKQYSAFFVVSMYLQDMAGWFLHYFGFCAAALF